jgi:hypothetical protein
MSDTDEKMSDTSKLMWAVIGVFVVGFIMVGVSKQESPEQAEGASMIRNYVAIQTVALQKCPQAILNETGETVYNPSETISDKETYITLKWVGEGGKFKKTSCTVHSSLGGISELIIDDKVIIKKKI